MNVVVINDYAAVWGGGDQVAVAGARAIAERGHRVLFFAPSGPEVSPILAHPSITVDTLAQLDLREETNKVRGAIRGVWNWTAAGHLEKILRRFSPHDTVVHVHGWTKATTTALFPVIRRLGFQAVVTLHDFFVTCPNGAFFVFPKTQICHRVPLSLSCLACQCDRKSYLEKLWRYARHVVQKFAGGLPQDLRHAIVISRYSETLLKPHLSPATVCYFVPNPIEVEKTPRVLCERNQLFLYVGRLTTDKGPDLLAEAAARLDLPVRFVGEGYLREKIMQLNPAAEITGWVDRESVGNHFGAARALVFTSRWQETFGLTVGEALARGLPVVVADNCGAAGLVVDGVNGLLFRSDDPGDLERKLSLLADSSFVQRLSEEGHARYWRDPLSLEAHARSLEAAYDNVLAAQQAS